MTENPNMRGREVSTIIRVAKALRALNTLIRGTRARPAAAAVGLTRTSAGRASTGTTSTP